MNASHVEQDMNVICNATDNDERRSHVTQRRRKVTVDTFAYIVLQNRKPILGAEDQMRVQL